MALSECLSQLLPGLICIICLAGDGSSAGDFMEYAGCIPGHNDLMVYWKTVNYCKGACLREKTFCCRSFEYFSNDLGSGTCYMSKDWSQTVHVTKPCYSNPDMMQYFERIEPDCSESTPEQETTGHDTTVQETSMNAVTLHTTLQGTTVKDMTTKLTTAQDTTVQETTVQETTALGTTAQDTTVQETTVGLQGTTALGTTAQYTTLQETTAQGTSVERTTVQDTALQEMTVEQTAAQYAVVQETTVQETTVDGTTVRERTLRQTTAQDKTEMTTQSYMFTHQNRGTTTSKQDTAQDTTPVLLSHPSTATQQVPTEGNAPPRRMTLRQRVPIIKESLTKSVPTEAKGAEYIGGTELILLSLCGLVIFVCDFNTYRRHLKEINGIVYLVRGS